jgi:hypothetical protein
VELDRVQLDATRHDPVSQQVSSQHILIGKEGIAILPVKLRYAWPSELDLMAQLAGLRPRARYGGWTREPFTASSATRVRVHKARVHKARLSRQPRVSRVGDRPSDAVQ